MKVHRMQNTIMEKNGKRVTSVQRFKGLSLMLLIGIRSAMLEETNGTGIRP